MQILFTYGTLMKGNSNNHYMNNAEFIGKATLYGYALYDLIYYPGIRPQKNEMVTGELYRINYKDFEKIQILEGDGILYVQHNVNVLVNGNKMMQAVVFVYNSCCEAYMKHCDGTKFWRKK